jgi:EmrB/QacA subfamily drug resistance transporter
MATLTSPPPAAAAPAAARFRQWAPLAVVLTGTCMSVLDFFIVNVALPSMQRSLHAGGSTLEWVGAGYALTAAVLLIASGRLGDRFGRRRTFVTGLTLFTLASTACGVAPDSATLVVGRLLQGAAGALMTTNVLSLIGVLYSAPAERAKAMGAYATVMGFAAVGGQLIGGALLQLDPLGLSWRSCFLINVPVGIAALVAARRVVPESRGQATSIDLPGIALITATLTALVLPLVDGRQLGWPAWCWISLGLVAPLLALFVAQQRRVQRNGSLPLLDGSLLRLPSVRAGLLAQLVFWCGQGSFFLILALFLQQGRGLTPLAAGGIFVVLALPYVATSMRAPGLTARYGRNVVTAAAVTLVTAHLMLIGTVALTGSIAALIPALALVGVGMGLGIAPLAAGLLATLRPEQAGAASGALSTAQYVGSALGVALVGIAFFGGLGAGFDTALQHGLWVLVGALSLVAVLSRWLP